MREDHSERQAELEILLREPSSRQASEAFLALSAEDQRWCLDHLPAEEQVSLLDALEPAELVEVFEHFSAVQAVELLKTLTPLRGAVVTEGLPARLSSEYLRELSEEKTQSILSHFQSEGRREVLQNRLHYPDSAAGALMRWRSVSFDEEATVGEFLSKLHRLRKTLTDLDFQYFYTVNQTGHLTGVLNVRTILFSPPETLLREIKIAQPYAILDTTNFEELQLILDEKDYLSFPVVNVQGVFLGVIGRFAIAETLSEVQSDDFLKSKGVVGGDELRSMPTHFRATRRLSWLLPNIVLNMLSAIVIAGFKGTLEQVILLAVFLPVVSNMSGCSGSQAIAISIRELTMGVISYADYGRVLWKEFVVGLPTGALLGVVLGLIAGFWGGNVVLGAVIGFSLLINVIISVLLGGMLPLILKRMKVDPALASSPILTTCTDLCGFLCVLGIATILIEHLV